MQPFNTTGKDRFVEWTLSMQYLVFETSIIRSDAAGRWTVDTEQSEFRDGFLLLSSGDRSDPAVVLSIGTGIKALPIWGTKHRSIGGSSN